MPGLVKTLQLQSSSFSCFWIRLYAMIPFLILSEHVINKVKSTQLGNTVRDKFESLFTTSAERDKITSSLNTKWEAQFANLGPFCRCFKMVAII